MNARSCQWLCLLSLFWCQSLVAQIVETQNVKTPASVAGRVLLDGKPAANINVAILPDRMANYDAKPKAQTRTDAEGQFRFSDLPPGKYNIASQAPAFVLTDDKKDFLSSLGQSVVLGAGETAEDIEIKLRRGAVITGSVSDAKGKPVIAEQINLKRFAENGKAEEFERFGGARQGITDDRGVYRFYGLDAGRYLVSIGVDAGKGGVNRVTFFSTGQSSRFFPLTFSPAATNETEAKIVAVEPGDEAENVDIQVGEKKSSFKIAGRVVNSETGAPFENAKASLNLTFKEEKGMSSRSFGEIVKPHGDFELNGILPGKYEVTLNFRGDDEFFVQPVAVEITDHDATNVEIKAASGLSLSGTATIENSGGASLPLKLSELRLFAMIEGENHSFQYKDANIKENGSFRFAGLPPGKTRISLSGYPSPKGLRLARIERGGAIVQPDDLRLETGRSINGLRLILIYGNETLRGAVKIEDGEKHPNAKLSITAKPTAGNRSDTVWSQVDERGKFLLENLTAEEYEVTTTLAVPGPEDGKPQSVFSAKQRVTIAGGVENQVTLIINLSQGAEPPQ